MIYSPSDKKELRALLEANIPADQIDVSLITDMSWLFAPRPYMYPEEYDHSGNSGPEWFEGLDYNCPLESWDVSHVTNMEGMFASSKYNHPLNNWKVGNVVNMNFIFQNSEFNHPLDRWNPDILIHLDGMFTDSKLTYSIEKWDLKALKKNIELGGSGEALAGPIEGSINLVLNVSRSTHPQ